MPSLAKKQESATRMAQFIANQVGSLANKLNEIEMFKCADEFKAFHQEALKMVETLKARIAEHGSDDDHNLGNRVA